jgi:CRISPR-associated protein Cas2
MALNQQRTWLICYDITDPRRLVRLHRFLRKHAEPVQYSVFYYEASAAQLGRLVGEIEARIDRRSDDVRIYQLPERLECTTLGRGSLPGGSWLLSDRGAALAKLTQAAGG